MAQGEKPAKLSMANTKREMLEEYRRVVEALKEKRENELRPDEALQKKQAVQAVAKADSLSSEGVEKAIAALRTEISAVLNTLPDKFSELLNEYHQLSHAADIKKEEIKELYEIDTTAETLAALIESQQNKRREFDEELTTRKRELEAEIRATREAWDAERKKHDEGVKQLEAEEKRRREREREEYEYTFAREKQLAKDRFADEQETLEREIAKKRRELEERESAMEDRETELAELRERVKNIQAEIDQAVAAQAKAVAARAAADAKAREDLLKKQFDGERNVLTTKISALEQTVKEQEAQIARLASQLEKSYAQVQDIAVKAIEGSSGRAAAAEEYSRKVSQVQGQSRSDATE